MAKIADRIGMAILAIAFCAFVVGMIAQSLIIAAPIDDGWRATYQDASGNEYTADYALTLSDCLPYVDQGYACRHW